MNYKLPRKKPQRAHFSRTPIRTYKTSERTARHRRAPLSRSHSGAGCSFHPISPGVMNASTAIHWDVGVFNHLMADGCKWLEVKVKTTGHTYRCSVDTMLAHGQKQHRFGLQWVLHLKYWSVDGQPAEAPPVPITNLGAGSFEQQALFELGEKMAVSR